MLILFRQQASELLKIATMHSVQARLCATVTPRSFQWVMKSKPPRKWSTSSSQSWKLTSRTWSKRKQNMKRSNKNTTPCKTNSVHLATSTSALHSSWLISLRTWSISSPTSCREKKRCTWTWRRLRTHLSSTCPARTRSPWLLCFWSNCSRTYQPRIYRWPPHSKPGKKESVASLNCLRTWMFNRVAVKRYPPFKLNDCFLYLSLPAL